MSPSGTWSAPLRWSLTGLEVTNLLYTGWPVSHRTITDVCHSTQHFCWTSRNQTQVPMLIRQAHYQPSHPIAVNTNSHLSEIEGCMSPCPTTLFLCILLLIKFIFFISRPPDLDFPFKSRKSYYLGLLLILYYIISSFAITCLYTNSFIKFSLFMCVCACK